MKLQRVRIDEKGWDSFSGDLQGIQFTDGISDEPMPEVMTTRLGAIMRIVGLDDDVQVGAAQFDIDVRAAASAPNPEDPDPEPAEEPESDDEQSGDEPTPRGQYNRKDLETMADEGGIVALRAVATPMGVKGRSIPDLITGILNKQQQ